MDKETLEKLGTLYDEMLEREMNENITLEMVNSQDKNDAPDVAEVEQ